MTTNGLPAPIAELGDILRASGFHASDEVAAERFGNRMLTFTSGDLSIRVTSDRGEWSVELSPGHDTGWFLAELWQQCLAERDVDVDAAPLDEVVRFIGGRIHRLQELTANDESRLQLIECLLAAQEARGSAMRKAIFGEADG